MIELNLQVILKDLLPIANLYLKAAKSGKPSELCFTILEEIIVR